MQWSEKCDFWKSFLSALVSNSPTYVSHTAPLFYFDLPLTSKKGVIDTRQHFPSLTNGHLWPLSITSLVFHSSLNPQHFKNAYLESFDPPPAHALTLNDTRLNSIFY